MQTGTPIPLVTQIHDDLLERISRAVLPAGTRLPSIRDLARTRGVSTLTVTNAYNRLVAEGHIEARRGSGFYVSAKSKDDRVRQDAGAFQAPLDASWLLHRVFQEHAAPHPVGAGWLPPEMLYTKGIRRALNGVSRKADARFSHYGNPLGYLPLRNQIRILLADREIDAAAEQIILTHGATQAIELAARCLLKAGDVAFVDDPGYSNVLPILDAIGARVVGVPRLQDGPDVAALETLALAHKPKLFITSSTLQNPTGTNCTGATAYKTLRLAETHDFFIVEDEIFAALENGGTQTMSALDQLQRVIYVSSFSKTISPSLRVGFLACPPKLADKISYLKMTSTLSSSETMEQIVHAILIDGHHRSHLARLRDNLTRIQSEVCQRLEAARWRVFNRPTGGFFVWAACEDALDGATVARQASAQGILLAPGHLFRPAQQDSAWFRFNVAYARHPKLYDFLSSIPAQAGT